jgi:sugar (pentulose or hexulose) kinase
MSRLDGVMGIDLGTTSTKVLIRDLNGRQLSLVQGRTPWTTPPDGGTETTAEALVSFVVGLLQTALQKAQPASTEIHILGVGVAGLAESGVLVDGSGRPRTPVIAWFDGRGEQQVARVALRHPDFQRRFVRRTGLPFDSQASVAKLMWFADQGLITTAEHRWLSIPEYIVHLLGGELVSEPSLASRTGLLDQASGRSWREGAATLGLATTLLPQTCPSGVSAGTLSFSGLPANVQGAALTVAGHDHPVAAIGVGATGADELFNSTGTADVIARSLPGQLTDDQREKLVGQGISAGSHILPDTTLLLGGVRGGLLLRRVLGLLGATDGVSRDRLDAAALEVGPLPAGLELSGAGPTGDDVILRVRDDASPPVVWTAATRYTAAETRSLLNTLHRVVRPHRRAVASGGWTRMASVRRAKAAAIERLEFADLPEPGVVGAAIVALQAASGSVATPKVPVSPV